MSKTDLKLRLKFARKVYSTDLINSKEVSRKACEIWLELRLHKDKATFQTLETWIGYNVMRYHNLNTLPHALPHTLPYIFSEIFLVLGYLQRKIAVIF